MDEKSWPYDQLVTVQREDVCKQIPFCELVLGEYFFDGEQMYRLTTQRVRLDGKSEIGVQYFWADHWYVSQGSALSFYRLKPDNWSGKVDEFSHTMMAGLYAEQLVMVATPDG